MIALYCPRCRVRHEFDATQVKRYTTTYGKAWGQARCPGCRTTLTTTKLDTAAPSSR